MKPFLLTTFGALALFTTATTFTSCKEDKCKATVCAYYGICNQADGSCTCQTGFEGARCETITRSKFIGVWRVTESGSSSNPQQYAVSIEPVGQDNADNKSINQVTLRNFYNLFDPLITATVKGDTIYIASQTVTVGETDYTIEGKGYLTPEPFYALYGQLVLAYSVKSDDGSVNYFGENGATNFSIWIK
jgi:hypothetical protein